MEDLDPCETYEVKVTVANKTLKVVDIGPFYEGNHSNVYLNSDENEHYEAYSQNSSQYVEIVSEETAAKILVTGLCARTIVLEVHPDGQEENAKQMLFQNDPRNSSKVQKTLSHLQPCTKYHVIMDLYLNTKATVKAVDESGEVDFTKYNFTAFHTMPSVANLDKLTIFDNKTKILSWNFTEFFRQDCVKADPTYIQVTFLKGSNRDFSRFSLMEEVSLEGTKKLDQDDCGTDFSLQVEYDKRKWNRSILAFRKFIAGAREATDEKVKIRNGSLSLTVDPCLGDPERVELVPLNADGHVPTIELTPAELRSSKLVSEVDWMGCLDYDVKIHRGGKEKQLNQLSHPGWKTALDGITLNVSRSTNDSVTLEMPKIFWDNRAFRMEVVCNEPLNEVDQKVIHFEVDEPLRLTGLTNQTQFKCKARLHEKDDGSTSGWSGISALRTQTQTSPAEKVAPSKDSLPSKGNLNFGSFIYLTLLSAVLLLKTTGPI